MNAAGDDEIREYFLSDPLSSDPIHLLPDLDLPLRTLNKSTINPSIKQTTTECTTHSEKHKYRCKYCSLTFPRTTELLKHTVFHTGDTRNQCKQCKLVLSSRDRLAKHQKTHDAVSANFQCDMCGVSGFESKRRLTSHIRLHVKACNKKSERLSSTDANVTDNVNEKFDCELCKKQFSRKSNFMAHVKRHYGCSQTEHSNVKVVKNHLCWICGKLFYKNHLIRHLHIHSGKRCV